MKETKGKKKKNFFFFNASNERWGETDLRGSVLSKKIVDKIYENQNYEKPEKHEIP